MSKSNPPPPKFGPINPAPQTIDDWNQLIRWFFSLWRTVEGGGSSLPPAPAVASSSFAGFDLAGTVLALAPSSVLRSAVDAGVIPPAAVQQYGRILNEFAPAASVAPIYQSRRPIEIIVCTQATFPTLTGTVPAFVYVTDYAHMIFWDGTTAAFADGGNAFVALFWANPGTGWHLLDGATTNYLNADGTTTSIALEDLTTNTTDAAYLKAGSPNAGPNAATAATFTGTPAVLTGTVSAPLLTMNSNTPAGSVSAGIFTGTPIALTSSTFTPVALATTAITSVGGSTTTVTPGGTNTAGTFTGTPEVLTGTNSAPSLTMNSYTPGGTNSTNAEPRNLVRRPYFRR